MKDNRLKKQLAALKKSLKHGDHKGHKVRAIKSIQRGTEE